MANKWKNSLPLSSSSNEHLPDLVTQTTDTFLLPVTSSTHHVPLTSITDMKKMACLSPMRQQYTNLTVLDVYDEAALIGKDFERIIETYGTETIRDLVPKVIRILELLELQAANNEKQVDEYLEMKTRIERLETEKCETRELREKFEREFDLVEEQWRKEADSLMALVAKLQDENRRLRDDIQRNNDLHNKLDLSTPTDTINISREELQCIKNLTDENIKLKRILKSKEKELTQKTLDVEAIQAQLERLCKANCTLRQKNTFSTNQTQRLMIEKFDLEVQLKEKENIINQMKDRLGNETTTPTSPINPIFDSITLGANQPRFTLEELRQVLWERNDLKTKLLEVEEELRLFKTEDEEDGDVEGPIPLEPEEKLNGPKRDESKVRQFLRSLFPLSKKTSTTVEDNLSETSLVLPSTPTTSTMTSNISYSTFSSSPIHSNGSLSTQTSIESRIVNRRRLSKANIPVLSPPASE